MLALKRCSRRLVLLFFLAVVLLNAGCATESGGDWASRWVAQCLSNDDDDSWSDSDCESDRSHRKRGIRKVP